MLKKYMISVLFTIWLLFLGSCSNIRGVQLTKVLNEEGQKIQSMSEEIIRCLTEKDSEAFTELFCDQVRNEDIFDKQIEKLFDFFECDSYIKSEIDTVAAGGDSREYGMRTEWYVIPQITYIEVLVVPNGDYNRMNRRYYGVNYYWQITDTENPSLEGLHNCTVELLNTDESVMVGTTELQSF